MNREQFLKQLEGNLQGISSEERQDILQDYEEYFAIGREEGKTEEEMTASLGSPTQIAKELFASHHLEKVETSTTAGNIMRAVWAVIGLGFFNFVIVMGPFIALIGVMFSGWAVGAVFVLSPLLVLVNAVIAPETFTFFDLFVSVALCGIGLFIAIGMLFATKAVTRGFVRYLKFNRALVKGGLKRE